MMYMATVRTQVYLTEAQRARLNDRAQRQGVRMAHIIREAIDSFLSEEDDIEATFGAAPDIAHRVPSRDEWERRG
jgi:predicted DNA-binding protein